MKKWWLLLLCGSAMAQEAYLPDEGSPPALEVPAGQIIVCFGMSQAHWTCSNRITSGWASNNAAGLPVIVNAARSGWHTRAIVANQAQYWSEVETEISRAGYSNSDVAILWGINATMVARDCPAPCDEVSETAALTEHLEAMQDEAEARFPNLVAGFHTSRMNGTWCRANPEPIARETYTAIMDAVADETLWHLGPYIWADTSDNPRADGHFWVQGDFVSEPQPGPGCHPSALGVNKILPMLDRFFLQIDYGGTTPPPPPPPEDGPTNLQATFVGGGIFDLTWDNEGGQVICGATTIEVSGESWSLTLPDDLAFNVQHSCRVDNSNTVTIGCRTSSNCRVF